ncbi:hypothetical protein WEI85_42270 [Actinomycetes bacterium KLBMP 9797]
MAGTDEERSGGGLGETLLVGSLVVLFVAVVVVLLYVALTG